MLAMMMIRRGRWADIICALQTLLLSVKMKWKIIICEQAKQSNAASKQNNNRNEIKYSAVLLKILL